MALALAAVGIMGSGRLAAQITNTPPQVGTLDLDLDRDGVADFTQTATSEQHFGDTRTQPLFTHVWVARTTVTLAAGEGIEFLVGPDLGDPRLGGQPFLTLHVGDEIGPSPPEGWRWQALQGGIMTWREEVYYNMAPWEPPPEAPPPTLLGGFWEGSLAYVRDNDRAYVGVRFRRPDGWHYGYMRVFYPAILELAESSLNPAADSPVRAGDLPWLWYTPRPWFNGYFSVLWDSVARDLGYVLEQTASLVPPRWAAVALPDPHQLAFRFPKGGAPLFFRLHKGTP